MKKLIVRLDLLKAHVKGYTRKDGTFVAEHDDKRPSAVKGALYDKDDSALGPHKVGDTVSYKGERGTRTGKVKGARDGKVVVEHKAGYTELKHHSELSPAAMKKAAPKFQEGDTVKVTGNVRGAGKTGFIHSSAPSGNFHIVEHADGSRSSYHESDLAHHDPDDDEDDDDDRDR